MLSLIARRIAGAALVLLAVSFCTFVLLDLAPGDAADTLAGDEATAEQREALRRQLGLADPLPVRYGRFLAEALLEGDLGESAISGRPVSALVAERFGYTLVLFIGLGAQPPTPEWGSILAAGRDSMDRAWWVALFPGLAITGSVMGFNLLGDGRARRADELRSKL